MSDTAKKSAAATGPVMIQADRLSKYYGVFAACRDVSFTVRKGELVAFLGPNGAGKSTTMKLLTGYLAPSQGVARIAGHDMATDRIAGSAKLGYLPENGPLYPGYDALIRCSSSLPTPAGCRPSYKDERIGAVIDLCVLGSVIHKPISKLSKGFRQRVGMAQALLHEPDVLIMDEPTAGLDPNQIVEVRKTLLRIAQEQTILLSTHILQEVEAMAQRVILINEGRLVFDGTVAELESKFGNSLDQAFHSLTAAAAAVH